MMYYLDDSKVGLTPIWAWGSLDDLKARGMLRGAFKRRHWVLGDIVGEYSRRQSMGILDAEDEKADQ